jgi:prepilin-type N-terminal cleavage/methylation domain-containing protein
MKNRKRWTFQKTGTPFLCHSREGGNPVLNRWIPGQARNDKSGGFTLVELILVVLILSIAALVAIPMFSSAADIQVRSVANRIAADLDYARGLAITRQKNYAVVFDPANESYDIREAGFSIIKNPLDGKDFLVDLTADHRISGVNIESTNFTDAVTFDYLGTPYPGNVASPTARLNDTGVITLQSKDGRFVIRVKVEPLTGYVTIE